MTPKSGSRPASADQLPPPSGTRPEGTRDAREAGVRVREMFSRIAPRYDFLNHLLSLSLDRVWRRRAAQRFEAILARPDARILDLCCGTGDLTFALERAARRRTEESGSSAAIFGGDFAFPMLDRARAKGMQSGHKCKFLAADALSLPFADASFDLVTAAFGFRNLANYEGGLREMSRVIRPGGQIGVLEFSDPANGIGAPMFRFYFRKILPRIGGVISGSREAYSYLPASVANFPSPLELSSWIERLGFSDVRYELWNLGSVVLHQGTKR